MVRLIIGQNAIGKSVYIKNKAKKELEKCDKILCNIWDSKYLINITYNEDRIEALYDILDAEEITENRECLLIKSNICEFSQSMLKIVSLICKEGSKLYLDEPEYGLTNREIGYLVAFIYNIMDTFDEVEIVTHSELFFGIQEAEVVTVSLDKNKKYVISELGENAYVTID